MSVSSTEKVSIIMPAHNAERFIAQAIQSVLSQTHQNLELIIVNDGSSDATDVLVRKFSDSRIRYVVQQNKGVSAARNAALSLMTGDFFCFLDADDQFPIKSLQSRLEIFRTAKRVNFVDGSSDTFDERQNRIVATYRPRFRGAPMPELLRLNSGCFFGLTWLIRRKEGMPYSFDESINHGEDLDFFVRIAEDGWYDYTNETILIYRTGINSAMSNLPGLEAGYRQLLTKWSSKGYLTGWPRTLLKVKMTKIMFLSYLQRGRWWDALRVLSTYISS